MQRTQTRTVCERLECCLPNENCVRDAVRDAVFSLLQTGSLSYKQTRPLPTRLQTARGGFFAARQEGIATSFPTKMACGRAA